jgi:hypothetical protein
MWPGKMLWHSPRSGPYSGRERHGDTMVPRHVLIEFEGKSANPDMTAHVELRNGRPILEEIRIKAKPEGRGIRSSDLTSVRVDALVKGVIGELSLPAGYSDEPFGGDWQRVTNAQRSTARLTVDQLVRKSGRGVSQAELQIVASIHNQHLGGNALAVIADTLHVSERTAARRVAEARSAGLIAPRTSTPKEAS